MPTKSLVLLDGYNLLHRGCAVPSVGGARYILRNVLRFRRDFTHGAVVFDTPSSRTYRRDLLTRLSVLTDGEGYKALRSEKTDLFVGELKKARAILGKIGFHTIDAVDVEADDVLYGLSRRAEEVRFSRVLLVTGDHDLYAAVSRKTSIHDGMTAAFTQATFAEKFAFPPSRYADYLAFVGKHDQVPGVRGIGAVSANALLKRFKTLRNVLSADEVDLVETTNQVIASLVLRNTNRLWLGRALARLHVPQNLVNVESLAIE